MPSEVKVQKLSRTPVIKVRISKLALTLKYGSDFFSEPLNQACLEPNSFEQNNFAKQVLESWTSHIKSIVISVFIYSEWLKILNYLDFDYF